jgi:hypothetical protein
MVNECEVGSEEAEEVEKAVEVEELEIEEGVNFARCCPLPVLSGNNRLPLYHDSVDSYIGILHYYPFLPSLSWIDCQRTA